MNTRSHAEFAEVTTESGTQRNWDRATLELEGRLLYRELEHLSAKSGSRALTYWEAKRMKQVKADISKILRALTQFQQRTSGDIAA